MVKASESDPDAFLGTWTLTHHPTMNGLKMTITRGYAAVLDVQVGTRARESGVRFADGTLYFRDVELRRIAQGELEQLSRNNENHYGWMREPPPPEPPPPSPPPPPPPASPVQAHAFTASKPVPMPVWVILLVLIFIASLTTAIGCLCGYYCWRKPNETRVLLRSEQAVIPIAVAEVADAEMNILASAVAKVFDKQ